MSESLWHADLSVSSHSIYNLSLQPDTPENGLDLLPRTTLMNYSELCMLITVLEARGLHAELHTSLVYALFSTLANSNAHIPKHKMI